MKRISRGVNVTNRRRNVIDRLESQLSFGYKPSKDEKGETIPLTDSDRKRITKELETLKTRL